MSIRMLLFGSHPLGLEVIQGAAAKLALNPEAQVVAPAMYKAFRQADMHNNIYRGASRVVNIGSRTLSADAHPR
jgi:hypothetical protein